MQDLISSPFRRQTTTEGSEHEEGNYAEAFWQIRINNLESVLQRTHLQGRPELSFNLKLTDPISQYLGEESTRQGISGDYTITLGKNAERPLGIRPVYPCRNPVGSFKGVSITT
ncbi:MAG: hypothetical protein ACI80L_001428 [Pseudohongiellaceae bacterium]|jgi:hypothetical protein